MQAERPTFLERARHGREARALSSEPAGRYAWVALSYGTLGALGAGVAVAMGSDPLTTDPWIMMDGPLALAASVVLGLVVAWATTRATRAVVAHASWGRQLHGDLRPVVHGADDSVIVVTAIASGLGEELFFRGLLVPIVGVVASSLAFGLLHQIRGRARWAWAGWALLMGLIFGALFKLTGQLAGPVVAHVVINGVNLRYLRDKNPLPGTRALGGLLEPRARAEVSSAGQRRL